MSPHQIFATNFGKNLLKIEMVDVTPFRRQTQSVIIYKKGLFCQGDICPENLRGDLVGHI